MAPVTPRPIAGMPRSLRSSPPAVAWPMVGGAASPVSRRIWASLRSSAMRSAWLSNLRSVWVMVPPS